MIEDPTADFSFRYGTAFRQKSEAFLKPSRDIETDVNKQRSAMVSATVKQIETLMMVAGKNVKHTEANPDSLKLIRNLRS